MKSEIHYYWKALLSILYGHRCSACKKELTLEEDQVCSGCLRLMVTLRPPLCPHCAYPMNSEKPENKNCHHCLGQNPFFDSAFSLLEFNGTTKTLIHQIKYYKKDWLLKKFIPLLSKNPVLSLEKLKCDYIVPIPLSWFREWNRGFNQALLLSRLVQRWIRRPILQGVIKRKYRTPQTALGRKDRLTRQVGSFKIRKPKALTDKVLLLVDDVLTTGGTVNECARLLKNAGAKKVIVFTLARTL